MYQPLSIALVLGLSLVCCGTLAQQPQVVATCLGGFGWTFNSLNQSPCEIAANLAQVCIGNGQSFSLLPLPPGQAYGIKAGDGTPCVCNTVYYSLLSACSLCQGRNFNNWSIYHKNCTDISENQFPDPIPPTTSIPHYAFLNVTASDRFNATQAQGAGGSDSSALPGPTSTGSSPSSLISPSQTSTIIIASITNTAAIAGGVVGGVLGLALIFGVLYYILRRKHHHRGIRYDIDPDSPKDQEHHTIPITSTTITPFMSETLPSSTTEQPPAYQPTDPRTSVLSSSSAGYGSKSDRFSSYRPNSLYFSGVPESEIHEITSSAAGH